MDICLNFDWPTNNTLSNKEWDLYKSAIVLKNKDNLNELEIAAIDTTEFIICYSPNGIEGYQCIFEKAEGTFKEKISRDIYSFFKDQTQHFFSEYEPVAYNTAKRYKGVITIPKGANFTNLNLVSFTFQVLLPLLLLIPWNGVELSASWKIAVLTITSVIFLPKLILLIIHSIKSSKYSYTYSVQENKLVQFREGEILETIENVTEIIQATEAYWISNGGITPTSLGYSQFCSNNKKLKISTLQLSTNQFAEIKIKPEIRRIRLSYPLV